MKKTTANKFQHDLLQWYDTHKRDLPWRRERDPYKIWVSEIMLQQTQVDTVIPYYERFMRLFPTAEALADADEETVLKAWEGLGYYSRARNLHQAVKEVKETYGGKVPDSEKEVKALKGVGPYTAGAILSIAFNTPAPAVDGNVMRVLSRIFAMYDDIAKPAVRKKFEEIVMELIPADRASDFNQALMELGAVICTPKSPGCLLCPVREHCDAREEGVQNLLPVKAKKKPPKKMKMKVALVRDQHGRVLIEKRPEKGLLANLWQFPNIEAESDDTADLNRLLASYGLDADVSPHTVQVVKHVFSHIVWEMEVYKGQAKVDNSTLTGKTGNRLFVEEEEVTFYPFPVSHQKIIDGALKERGE